ncbi:hypothetical protein UY416_25400 [Paenibacillus polymyxa]|uniref:hypothetical protein n=1 Tax=Paenibacillus polymyxa TaxID=1406 RepID=UPI002AB4A912|nr:hypothetical protein [Paenibacillus polymyxa]MDY8049629.1 hypothetical protein [Paenibacillus polymyxa]
MALPSRIGDRLPALFPSRAIAPTDSITWTGYGSYDQSATTAYSSFSNRGLASLKQFPVRFIRHCTTYFFGTVTALDGVTSVSSLFFVLPYVG